MPTLDEIKQQRIQKLQKLQESGIDPFTASFDKQHTVAEARNSEGSEVQTAGRVMSFRTHGNIAFADLQDESGRIQIFFKKTDLGDEAYKLLKLLDISDFIGVSGPVGKTAAGELSIIPTKWTFLSKALRPMPDEWYGIKDVETRYRQRYLDLMLNPDVRQRLDSRTMIVRTVRNYLDSLGFMEVETPVLQPLYGGANAKPFITFLNALGVDMFLRIAPELYLKRLIAGGYEKVYEIARNFRNEGMDRTHNPEFSMIEWYEAYADYQRMMDVTEGLFKTIAEKVFATTEIHVGDTTINIGEKWPRIKMVDLIKEKLGIDVLSMTDEELLIYAQSKNIELIGGESRGQLIFTIFDELLTADLIQPTWVIDYPADVSPLAKNHPGDKDWVQRFEGYIGGKEICDGWSEINNPIIQRERFTKDTDVVHKDDEEAQVIDEDFITSMEHGMPPLGGIGIGIERLVMFFTNTWAIKEVMWYPTLRPEKRIMPKSLMGEGIELFRAGSDQLFYPTKTQNNVLTIDEEVRNKWPSMVVGYAILEGVQVQKSHEDLETLQSKILEELEALTEDEIKKFKEIQSYRKLYEETGVSLKSRRPSPEALLRRVASQQDLYSVNTCVDAYNLVVMKNRVSIGAFDLDNTSLPTILKLSRGGESMVLIGGEEKSIEKGEMCYYDQTGPYNLDLNYRDADRTKVTENTQRILINVEGVHDISRQQVERTLQEVIMMIEKFCGGTLTDVGIA